MCGLTGVIGGRGALESHVRSTLIEIEPPSFDLFPSVVKGREPLGVEALVAE